MTAARLVATLGGVGLLRPGPGTWGSALVLPLVLLGPLPCLVLAALVTLAGFWAAPRVLKADEDPGWFVADEGAGMLLALAALPAPSWIGVALAFVTFRALDIAKPWPVSWADRQTGALGVMLDDLVAGAIAAGALLALQLLWPGALG
ncbi:phosphatidylglycerophosphatase A family protein [Falsiroseomonas oryziterrae]|uniref:phosphatidylglycerophosphatase A family protein n=1 Tax=Falsiroseomonas oryziterrae TaxID=2911368 RepID=UPI001F39B390|nr:phosphatidylglycerophosphatase A [Roseomonas sp. NPKOSM-4]